MAQLRRLRELCDAQERVFTTVPGLVDHVTQLGPSRGRHLCHSHVLSPWQPLHNWCVSTLCPPRQRCVLILNLPCRRPDQYSGTHLEFIDAESATVFDDARSMLLAIPLNKA
jgi:hypothetical protein